MIPARLCIEDPQLPQTALSRARVLLDGTRAAQPLVLYAAGFAGDALLLGAYQHAQQALSPEARASSPLLARSTGGITLRAQPGVLYVALGLHQRSVLMTCPPLRILNRNVRGALAGLRKLGVPAHYFGRDFISIDARPGAFVGWNAAPDGRVCLEILVAVSAPYLPEPPQLGYPPRADDPFRGKQPITLAQAASGPAPTAAHVAQQIASGYAAQFQVAWTDQALTPDELDRARQLEPHLAVPQATAREEHLHWSAVREDAIGFVSAGVSLDGSGKLSQVRLAGDFFQDRGCAEALQRTLLGVAPTRELVGRGIDAVYAQGAHELEGLRTLTTVLDAILDAAERARRS